MSVNITIIIIIITAVTSFAAFRNRELMDKLIFYPPDIARRKQWYRFFSNGLIHADIGHLGFNMYSFYLFGPIVEDAFVQIFGDNGKLLYLLMYVSALAACLVPTYRKNKENYYYRSLGASGAVSAVIFAAILLQPLSGIGLIFIPGLTIPGFVFGPLYLIVTAYLDKRGGGGINHSAHLWGALYGVAFLIAMSFALHTGFNPFTNFVDSVRSAL
jgi:membrane associated rhomboid family serine protease